MGLSNHISHPFHLTDESPWPLTAASYALGLTVGILKWFHLSVTYLMAYSLFIMTTTAFVWWRDISREGAFQGLHTDMVVKGLQWGIMLFITSEVFFFLSFFWAFFHSRLAPNIELGAQWPPAGIMTFNPWGVPFLNTVILLSSGVRVTWSHKSIVGNYHGQTLDGLLLTIVLGTYFTILQGIEYVEATFTIADSVFGSAFFVATGFHGLHVIVGTLFLFTCYLRINTGLLSSTHHFGLLAPIWYWHFVDVVWLFLYRWLYSWRSL